jgi:dihydrodipicolinate synthase/N-acetylneuraminate lyase
MARELDARIRQALGRGTVIPAHPLALTAERRLDERRQRALTRYYIAAGAGGLAVGVHTTEFAIRDPRVGLFDPVLKLAAEEMDRADRTRLEPLIRIGGICGETAQAAREAQLLAELGYHAGLLSLAALKDADDQALVDHCRRVAKFIPIVGFYLQPAAGGRILSYRFWREFAEIENVVAIKIAPFPIKGGRKELRIVGGLLGHWAVWTRKASELLRDCQAIAYSAESVPQDLIRRGVEVTDANAAFFDAANHFAGCISGLHEVLRRQGLLEGIWCLDPQENLSRGQKEEIDRVYLDYPHLNDDDFVGQNLDRWLTP